MLTHLDLFSGIGGFALACEWAGIGTIGFVEIDKYCQKVLRKHYPNVPIVEDIRDVEEIKEIVANATGERLSHRGGTSLANAGGKKPESKRCSGSRSRIQSKAGIGIANTEKPTILVTAGFPCQPFSVAGKRGGERDDRYLWPETLAVIEAIKPTWVLLENVAGIKSVYQSNMLSELEGREYNTQEEATLDYNKVHKGTQERWAENILWLVLEGLKGAGYEVQTLVIPACAVNAWHRRDRIWIIANNASYGCNSRSALGRDRLSAMDQDRATSQGKQTGERWLSESRETDNVPNSRCEYQGSKNKSERTSGDIARCDWWAVEPELGRVAHGIPNRVDRLKCLGNAIVPQVAYQILKVIADYENNSLQDQH